MADFNPSPHDRIVIAGHPYRVMPHPAVPTFAFGQEGRKAFVYQISGGADQGTYALKKFKDAYRLPELVGICDHLARFAPWPGLEVCARQCLNPDQHPDILAQHPDLIYAVLMPWIGGSTWYDMVIGMTPLSRLEALTYASAVAQVLAALEEASLAHCDISAANVIINPNTARAHLIDVEDLYAPGFAPPASLPAGTDGYAHRTAASGLWGPEADRFAGAVLMAEMAAWHVPQIRKDAEDEHYFSPAEMQEDSPRYRLMQSVLHGLDPRLAELFEQAWFSDTLADAPRLKEWQEVLSALQHSEQVAGVVSTWQPLSVPGLDLGSPQPTPERQPISMPAPADAPPAPPVPAEEIAAPPASEDKEEAPPAAPQPAAAEARPAPATPIIQPAPAAAAPPAPALTPRPIQVQPPRQAGGPIREWRPLAMPQLTPSPPAQPAERRPIWQPPAEELPADEPETQEPETEQPFADEVLAPETPSAPDEAPRADDFWQPGPEPEAEPPAEAGDGLSGVEPDPFDAADDLYAADGDDLFGAGEDIFAADGSAEAAQRGLLRPILDLTHVDDRNRPHLVWSESPGAAYYLLQEDSDAAFLSPREHRIKSGDTRWSPGLLWRRSGRLYFRIRAEDGDTAGPWSDTLIVRLGK